MLEHAAIGTKREHEEEDFKKHGEEATKNYEADDDQRWEEKWERKRKMRMMML